MHYDNGYSSGLLVKTIYYNVSTNAYLQGLRYRKINGNGYSHDLTRE